MTLLSHKGAPQLLCSALLRPLAPGVPKFEIDPTIGIKFSFFISPWLAIVRWPLQLGRPIVSKQEVSSVSEVRVRLHPPAVRLERPALHLLLLEFLQRVANLHSVQIVLGMRGLQSDSARVDLDVLADESRRHILAGVACLRVQVQVAVLVQSLLADVKYKVDLPFLSNLLKQRFDHSFAL